MPTLRRQSVVELFRENPKLSFDLVRCLGHPLPLRLQARVADSDLSTAKLLERRADLVTLGSRCGRRELAVITEVQLRCSPKKRKAWPSYVMSAQSRYNCPAVVLVVTPSRSVASAAETFDE